MATKWRQAMALKISAFLTSLALKCDEVSKGGWCL